MPRMAAAVAAPAAAGFAPQQDQQWQSTCSESFSRPWHCWLLLISKERTLARTLARQRLSPVEGKSRVVAAAQHQLTAQLATMADLAVWPAGIDLEVPWTPGTMSWARLTDRAPPWTTWRLTGPRCAGHLLRACSDTVRADSALRAGPAAASCAPGAPLVAVRACLSCMLTSVVCRTTTLTAWWPP